MPDDERDGRAESAWPSCAGRRSPTTPGSAPGASARSSASSTPRCGRSATRATTRCSIDRITKLAQCSRVSFYQYFANKEDVFRQLAGQVARQVSASTEALDPLTADAPGWAAMRAWVARYAAIHARYEPVFHALRERRRRSRRWRAHTGEETVTRIHARLVTATLPPRQLDPVIRLLLEMREPHARRQRHPALRRRPARTRPTGSRSRSPTCSTARCSASTPTSTCTRPTAPPPPALDFGPEMLELLRDDGADRRGRVRQRRARRAARCRARRVRRARLPEHPRRRPRRPRPGVSHGAFYRYFRNKEELARILTRARRARRSARW